MTAKEERENLLRNTTVEDIDDIFKLWEVKMEMTRIDIKEQMEVLKAQVEQMNLA